MAKTTEILATLKKMWQGLSEIEVPTQDTFKKYSENEIKISEMVVGGKVELIDGEGQLSDAPNGEYELDNGKKFIVKDSLIESIEGQEAPKEEAPEEVAAEEAEAPVEEAPVEDTKVAELEARIADLEKTIKELQDSMFGADEANAEFIKQVTEMNAFMKTIVATPSQFSEVTKTPKEAFAREKKLLEIARLVSIK